MSITSIRLQSDLSPDLDELAKKLKRSKNWLINQAIREYIKNNQRDAKWEDTLAALKSVQAGRGISEEKVDKWLESWGADNEKTPPE